MDKYLPLVHYVLKHVVELVFVLVPPPVLYTRILLVALQLFLLFQGIQLLVVLLQVCVQFCVVVVHDLVDFSIGLLDLLVLVVGLFDHIQHVVLVFSGVLEHFVGVLEHVHHAGVDAHILDIAVGPQQLSVIVCHLFDFGFF